MHSRNYFWIKLMLETKSRSLGLCQKTILPLGPNSPLFDQLKVVIPPFLTKLTQTDSFHIFFAFFKRIHDRKLESRMKLNLKKLLFFSFINYKNIAFMIIKMNLSRVVYIQKIFYYIEKNLQLKHIFISKIFSHKFFIQRYYMCE